MSDLNREFSSDILKCTLKPTTEKEQIIEKLSGNISNNIKEILVSETDIINEIIESIIDKLNIENKLTKIKVLHLLMKFINKKTNFSYNKINQKIIGIKLTEEESFKFINELGKVMLKDEHLIIKSGIHERKMKKISYLKKIEAEKGKKLKHIIKLESESYSIASLIYRLEDKGLSTLGTELEKSFIQNQIKQETNTIVELDTVIDNTMTSIDYLDQELIKLKQKEENLNYDFNTGNQLLSFSKRYILSEEKIKKGGFESKRFLNIGKNGRKIILGLSVIVGISLFIKIASNIPEDLKISEYSQNQNNGKFIDIPTDIIKNLSQGNIRKISGFESDFIIGVDTFPLEVVYPGNNIDNDVIMNTLLITYIDEKGIKQEPVQIKTYFYRKDITNKQIILLIDDASAEGQTINLTIKK